MCKTYSHFYLVPIFIKKKSVIDYIFACWVPTFLISAVGFVMQFCAAWWFVKIQELYYSRTDWMTFNSKQKLGSKTKLSWPASSFESILDIQTKMSMHSLKASLHSILFETYSHTIVSIIGMAFYSTVRKIHARFPAQDAVLLCKNTLFALTKSSPFSTKISACQFLVYKWTIPEPQTQNLKHRFSENPWSLLILYSIFSILKFKEFMGIIE